MTNPIELPARPRGQKMGSGRINGKYLELLMHSDEAMDAYGRACAEAAVAAQAAELEALRADAERYRFLRDKAWGKDGALALLPANEMDEAVDAARAALKEQEPNAKVSGA